MYQNVLLEGPTGVGRTQVANRLVRSLSGMNEVKRYLWEEASEQTIQEANSNQGLVIISGVLARRVYRGLKSPECVVAVEDEKFPEKGLDPKTLMVMVLTDAKTLAKQRGIDLERADEEIYLFFCEYATSPAPEKMILDLSKLPADIAAQHVMWATGQRIRR